ncbi:MAG: hydroxymethylbilane synthase [Planctomycetota bacterium]|jgi:hydroxymethylbilane synthase
MSARVLKVGTRGSALALAQARWVAAALEDATGVAPELVIVKTEGDRSAEREAPLGSRVGVFVREIEKALLDERVDLAVHSMKDVPTSLAEGTVIAACPEREDARDCMVLRGSDALSGLAAGARVGTSSARRRAQLLSARPDVEPVPIRGNVDTRLRKVAEGYDGIEGVALAMAGLARLGLGERVPEPLMIETLGLERFPTAAGQGALLVQARAGDEEAVAAASALDHAPTRAACGAERSFMHSLGAGCRTPVAAHAEARDGMVGLVGAVYSPDGSREVRGEAEGDAADAAKVGEELAAELASRGAGELLELSREA